MKENKITEKIEKSEKEFDKGPYAIIFEYNLARDKEIAFISCKSINNPETPKSGQKSRERACYYEWVEVIDDFQEAMDKKNHYVDVYKPTNMIKKKSKKKSVELRINTD